MLIINVAAQYVQVVSIFRLNFEIFNERLNYSIVNILNKEVKYLSLAFIKRI